MKVFVTGATGYIGTALCDVLARAGHTVSGLARSEEKVALLQSRGRIAVRGSLDDRHILEEASAEADAVIHTAMAFDEQAPERDHDAVEAILSATRPGRKPFIYTSGVWVMGDTRGRMLGEISMLRPPELVAWRPAIEDLVLASQGMVFRPGMVFGRAGGFLAGMFNDARSTGAVHIIGSGENHWSCVHIDDLAALYALAIVGPSPGELFITCGGMPQPVRKIALAVAQACGIEGKVESVPIEAARARYGAMADCLAMDLKAGSTKAARFFGWKVERPSVFGEIFSGSYGS
jgi:nucleoside-diphosphate-sugar epimerase